VVELYEAVAEEKNITITTQANVSVYIDGDRDLLFQVLVNLLDNAVKYTPHDGQISLVVQKDNLVTELIVADSGPGIPIKG